MTEHFFEPGAEYDDATPYSAPEVIRTFRCVAVAVLPGTGEPVAFGFMRAGHLPWGGTGMGLDHWRYGWNRSSPAAEAEPSERLGAPAEVGDRPACHYFATKADREAFAFMFGDKLDVWFTPEYAAYVRTGSYPDEVPSHAAKEPESLPELVSRLRAAGLNTAAEFFDSVQPIQARERVIARGNAYGDLDDTPWPTLDQEAWQPCPDCAAPDLCEHGDTELCP